MRRFLNMARSSFYLTLLDLKKNALRTFLSLFGISIGIFCMMGVLATVNSLEANLQAEIRSLGNQTIYLDKWLYSAGPDYPYWKYVQRPEPRYSEVAAIKANTPSARYVAFKISTRSPVEALGQVVSATNLYGVSADFSKIQQIEVAAGRYISPGEFYQGAPIVVLGHAVAKALFANALLALHQRIRLRDRQALVVGVLQKQGTQLIGGWNFDQSVLLPYAFARTLMNEYRSDPLILVQAKSGISSKLLQNDLRGALRAIRKLKPAEADNFALNDVSDFSNVMQSAFVYVNLGGGLIGALAFIVGIFGVANIMFVSVTERTPQIGLQKALGAKKSTILTGFLLDAAFLCLLGGLVGLLLVFLLTKLATALLQFPVFISFGILALTLAICLCAGLLAGFIPAIKAANMNPVEALRR